MAFISKASSRNQQQHLIMEKKRLVIMNRHCITQVIGDNGKWRDAKIEKAVERPAGIFNLHAALPADPSLIHDGVILYVDDSHVYQQSGKAIVMHDTTSFDRIPKLGAINKLIYSGGRAFTGSSQDATRRK